MDKHNLWARGAIRREPDICDYAGLGYEQASRRALAICAVAAETGQTINASYHLDRLRDVMARELPRSRT